MALTPPPGDQRLPEHLDLSPPEEIVERQQDLNLWLFNNAELVKACLTPLFHDVGATPWTIADNSSPSLVHVVHINLAGAVTVNLPANPKDSERFLIKDAVGDAGTFTKTIQVTGGGLIDGGLSATMVTNYAWLQLYGRNGNYFMIG